MVSVEREEGASLHPPITQLLVTVSAKPTGVDAKHWDSEEGEGEGLRDGEEEMGPD